MYSMYISEIYCSCEPVRIDSNIVCAICTFLGGGVQVLILLQKAVSQCAECAVRCVHMC
jgi:hypothetical protein